MKEVGWAKGEAECDLHLYQVCACDAKQLCTAHGSRSTPGCSGRVGLARGPLLTFYRIFCSLNSNSRHFFIGAGLWICAGDYRFFKDNNEMVLFAHPS